MNNTRRDSPSYHRNIEAITNKLHEILPKDKLSILEIGSGSGQHVARFAKEFPHALFQPTEYKQDNLTSINAWADGTNNILAAEQLDVTKQNWFADKQIKFDVLLCFNVIHITPWKVTEAIFSGASKVMNKECRLIFYGPFKVEGQHTSQSNGKFEKWLLEKDAAFGIRDIGEVNKTAQANGFELIDSHLMPANNFIKVFART